MNNPHYEAVRKAVVDKNHNQYRHGLSKTRQYAIWNGILTRCYNKKSKTYQRYGAKGIKVDKKWHDFQNFWDDMKDTYFDGASIDRIDGKKNYCKKNCRWSTKTEQNRNRCCVKKYKFNGLEKTVPEWEDYLGLGRGALKVRIEKHNWSIKDALTKKKIKYRGFYKDDRGKYRVHVKKDGKQRFVGRFNTIKEALDARKQYLKRLGSAR